MKLTAVSLILAFRLIFPFIYTEYRALVFGCEYCSIFEWIFFFRNVARLCAHWATENKSADADATINNIELDKAVRHSLKNSRAKWKFSRCSRREYLLCVFRFVFCFFFILLSLVILETWYRFDSSFFNAFVSCIHFSLILIRFPLLLFKSCIVRTESFFSAVFFLFYVCITPEEQLFHWGFHCACSHCISSVAFFPMKNKLQIRHSLRRNKRAIESAQSSMWTSAKSFRILQWGSNTLCGTCQQTRPTYTQIKKMYD